MTEPHGPLQGVKVVTCSTAQAGTVPYMLMADLGAEVLKIEDVAVPTPGPDEVRIRVHALGLNRAEALFREGVYLEMPELPARLGYEAGKGETSHTHPFSAVVVQLTVGEIDMMLGNEHSRARREPERDERDQHEETEKAVLLHDGPPLPIIIYAGPPSRLPFTNCLLR